MMDLFGESQGNLLPYDGDVRYHGALFTADESRSITRELLDTVAWQHDEAVIFGKRIVTARQAAWYGDSDYAYTYSGTTKHALLWTPLLLRLRDAVQATLSTRFNSCLLNFYLDGSQGMAWHSDDEKALGRDTVIASLSFGAARHFAFKHKRTAEKRQLVLASGSLLVMQGSTQTHWLHSLPKTTRITTPRVNLTFRTIVGRGV